jgi:hypothetical protein
MKNVRQLGFVLAAMLIAACSTSVDGSSADGGGGGGGLFGDKNASKNEKQGTAATEPANNGGTCTITTDNKTCDACLNAKCCSEIQACEGEAACASLLACVAKCASTDRACGQACAQKYSGGIETFRPISNCVNASCPTECE